MARLRPTVHFTPQTGWMNDPHGVTFDGERFHMFYQYVPNVTEWESSLLWGHAVSDDLVNWQEVEPALLPLPDEVGCWSGSVVIGDDNVPVMFYTSPKNEDWGHGRVVSAIGSADWLKWERTSPQPLIDGPAQENFFDFRDPQVRRDGDVWKMTIGGGIRDVGGAAFQYSSKDLKSWKFDGVIAHGDKNNVSPLYTGTVWECPQFLQVDGQWVLLISAMDSDSLKQELYALGDYDGVNFVPRKWGFFGHTKMMYATTTFTDNSGRACAISWLREHQDKTPEGSPWASAQGITTVMEIVNDRLVLTPHPDFDQYLEDRVDVTAPLTVDRAGTTWRLAVDLVAESRFKVIVAGESSWSLEIDRARNELLVVADETILLEMPLGAEPGVLDVIVDADLLEVFWSAGEGSAAVHVPANESATVTVMGSDFGGRLAR